MKRSLALGNGAILLLIFVSFILMLILLLQGAKAPLVVHEFILFFKTVQNYSS